MDRWAGSRSSAPATAATWRGLGAAACAHCRSARAALRGRDSPAPVPRCPLVGTAKTAAGPACIGQETPAAGDSLTEPAPVLPECMPRGSERAHLTESWRRRWPPAPCPRRTGAASPSGEAAAAAEGGGPPTRRSASAAGRGSARGRGRAAWRCAGAAYAEGSRAVTA